MQNLPEHSPRECLMSVDSYMGILAEADSGILSFLTELNATIEKR